MNLPILFILLGACAIMLLIERAGVPTTLRLSFKGDIKRETQFLAQWGQSVATPLCALVIWQLDPARRTAALVFVGAVLAASITCFIVKRLCGRVRPNREDAGKFLGFSWKHDNARESFPSSHSACAITASAYLSLLYPQGAAIFWGLGITTAVLRYVLDAHWPSDVLAGVAIGYVCAFLAFDAFHIH